MENRYASCDRFVGRGAGLEQSGMNRRETGHGGRNL